MRVYIYIYIRLYIYKCEYTQMHIYKHQYQYDSFLIYITLLIRHEIVHEIEHRFCITIA